MIWRVTWLNKENVRVYYDYQSWEWAVWVLKGLTDRKPTMGLIIDEHN